MEKPIYTDDERLYLQMMQANIERMSSNSANCKTWVLSLITGFFALLTVIKALSWWFLLTLVPIVMFWYLDGYYLSIERGMRNRQRDFLDKQTEANAAYCQALYNFAKMESSVDDKEKGLVKTTNCWFTKSIWPFYVVFSVLIVIATIAICLLGR